MNWFARLTVLSTSLLNQDRAHESLIVDYGRALLAQHIGRIDCEEAAAAIESLVRMGCEQGEIDALIREMSR